MKNKICVYTCICGDYDKLREVKNPEKGVDYYCFTNNKKLCSKTWRVVQIQDKELDDQRLSRKIKMLGEPSVMKDYEISVWMDASIVWKRSVVEFVERYLGDAIFAAFTHSQRGCVRDEAIACLKCRKDSKEKILDTLKFLKKEGFTDDNGLYEMTVFIKRHNEKCVRETMKIWFNMILEYSRRDQLSFPYVVWKSGLEVRKIELDVWNNEWFGAARHRTTNATKDCHLYYGDSTKGEFLFENYHSINYTRVNSRYIINDIVPTNTDRIEINPTNQIGIVFDSIQFSPKADIEIVGLMESGGLQIYCGGLNAILAHGKFRRGQHISLEIKLRELEASELAGFMEMALEQSVALYSERIKSMGLEKRAVNAENTLERIYVSRRWRTINTLARLLGRGEKERG